MRSIRRQVLAWVLGFLVLALLIMMVVSYQRALHEIEEIFDAELAQAAKLVGKLVLADIDSKGTVFTVDSDLNKSVRHKYEKYIGYQVWHRDSLMLKSAGVPDQALGMRAGFQDVAIASQQWRVYGLYLKGSDYRIFTAEEVVGRKELSWYFAVESLGVMFWAIPLFALIIALTVDRGLRPLKRLSEQVSDRDINQLRPVVGDHTPKELKPLVNALNGLLERLDAAISRERRFTTDASHELRTPLSAIRLHSQLAMRAEDLEESSRSLKKVLQAVDQSTHMVEQLLVLARLSPESGQVEFEDVDLTDICRKVSEQLTQAAGEKHIRIATEYPAAGSVVVNSNPHLLHTIFRNLLDNAIRYSPADSEIRCRLSRTDGELAVSIQDNGPGIPEHLLEQVQERFARLAG
ncbi:ATP-binding protein [Thiolapillus sp.]|uniref:ATP-binding protein n=6 Tax=Thiolapillus sp. TaxID=2017437 RepID=UPI003AF811C1